jgi:hypothetical protein
MVRATENRVMTISPRFWRVLTLLARIDISASIAVAAALWLWLAWH